ncbi:hypothetical protein CDD80_3005 [Ophiocordyceps camponoti-rufipedis]|uniref:BZIP domain-containing protein n=1 Tax=Ophiocordyceps camponoti-rufipedis TaxID=2004952 RepID=A0A2C5Z0M9_9HYPO|nr:hypothetical protein CDD80_3005 [Ophiocordyceps camponoti-rufipedis]
MSKMALQHPSPAVKFEASVDSFSSTQDLSLYSPASPAATVNPLEVLTPKDDGRDSPVSCVHDQSPAPTDSADKKPTKKRKSWGQVLPEPKTNLPPRKRAKTEDEKEQRRVERVLRNRRAAQSSRERKRLEVEALEKRNKELEAALLDAQKANVVLVQELHRVRRDSGVVTRSSSPLDSLRDNPVTLSQQLFGSQDGPKSSAEHSSDLVGELIMSTTNPTVNPASLSPELTPVPDLATTALSTPEPQACLRTVAASSDLTQRPAEMLCDLQCHTSVEASRSLALPTPRLGTSLGLSSAADADRYVLESGLLSSPNSSTLDDDYLACDTSAGPPTFDTFNIYDFLNEDANPIVTDTVAASDDAAAEHGLELQAPDPEIQVS